MSGRYTEEIQFRLWRVEPLRKLEKRLRGKLIRLGARVLDKFSYRIFQKTIRDSFRKLFGKKQVFWSRWHRREGKEMSDSNIFDPTFQECPMGENSLFRGLET